MADGRYVGRTLVALVVALLGAVSLAPTASGAPTVVTSFNPGGLMAGIAWDPSGNLFVYFDWETDIRIYSPDGAQVGKIPLPGPAGYHMDLDVTTAPMTVGGATAPAGSLLVYTTGNNTLHAIDPSTGTVLGSVPVSNDSLTVGVTQYPERGTVFTLDNGGRITEVDPATGAVLNQFPVPPRPGSSALFVSRGDVDVHPTTGNLIVAGSADYLLEVTPNGDYVTDFDLKSTGVPGGISGLGLDDFGDVWLTTTFDDGNAENDLVYKITGIDSGSGGLPKECAQAGAICTGDEDDDVSGTSADDFIFTGAGDDTVAGGAGDDEINGAAGNDALAGGAGRDRVEGGAGRDKIVGDANVPPGARAATGPSSDILLGGGGGDVISGEAGNDNLDGGGGNDILKGGPGVNILKGGPGKDTCFGDKKDKFRSCERLRRNI